MTSKAAQLAVALGLAQPGQRLIILAGVPFGTPGATNLLRLAYAPR
jgi:pyruvate kinase